MENRTVKERKSLVEKDHSVSVRRQSELLEINRSSLYIKPLGESKENLDLMAQMDRLYTRDPIPGSWECRMNSWTKAGLLTISEYAVSCAKWA